MNRHMTLARFVPLPENQAACHAIRDLATFLQGTRQTAPFNPLLLHGPSGSGKSHLATALAWETEASNKKHVRLSCREMRLQPMKGAKKTKDAPSFSEMLGDAADLLILEDLHNLPLPAVESLVQVIDERLGGGGPTVFTALTGPRHLTHRGTRYPARLASRLAAGLVVGIEPLSATSRKTLLVELAQRRQLPLRPDVVDWLVSHLGGTRQLEGAITQLETLSRLRKELDLPLIKAHFGPQTASNETTVERIAKHVCGYYRIHPSELQTAKRHRNVLLPRQVGMYLARQLTALSLEQIGAFFGGRDHTTVLHACRKVETEMQKDPLLSGAVKNIHAELS